MARPRTTRRRDDRVERKQKKRISILDSEQGRDEGWRYVFERYPRQTQTVKIETLDDLIMRHGRPHFCKIDVEGFEIGVLQGLIGTIKKHRPIVLVECSNSYYEVNKLFNIYSYHNLEYSKAEKSWIPSTGKNLMQIFVSSN